LLEKFIGKLQEMGFNNNTIDSFLAKDYEFYRPFELFMLKKDGTLMEDKRRTIDRLSDNLEKNKEMLLREIKDVVREIKKESISSSAF